jgi:SAM-dependent methyltransferase
VWFDDSNAEAKMVAFLEAQLTDGSRPGLTLSGGLSKARTSFLDLGCGNGSLLLALRDAGWRGRMLGVDYSSGSVELARRVARSRAGSAEKGGSGQSSVRLDAQAAAGADAHSAATADIDFEEWNALTGPMETVGFVADFPGWDVVLDKGTFDAISLSDETNAQGRRIAEGYRDRVLACLKTGGAFLVTSCNWTEAELTRWMEGSEVDQRSNSHASADARLRRVAEVQYKRFSFGGVSGQTICTLCFQKVAIPERTRRLS